MIAVTVVEPNEGEAQAVEVALVDESGESQSRVRIAEAENEWTMIISPKDA